MIYGSVQEEAKQALQVLAQWYQKGILDEQIFSRENIQEILDTGKAGILFGPWWMAEMLKNDIIKNKSDGKHMRIRLTWKENIFAQCLLSSINIL